MGLNLHQIEHNVTEMQEEVAPILNNPEKFGVNSELKLKDKGKDYTSAIDLRVEGIIKPKLLELIKGSGYLGEETESIGLNNRYVWIHDPLDGTAVKLIGGIYFSNSIALFDREANNGKGSIIFSSVYQPAKSKQFLSMGNDLTVREFIQTKTGELFVERIPRPSQSRGYAELIGCAFGTSKYMTDPELGNSLANIFVKNKDPILQRNYGPSEFKPASGSSALYCSNIADGNLHFALMFHQANWDMAGGATFAKKAGCPVVVFDNSGKITNNDLESSIGQGLYNKDTRINVGVFANKDVQEYILNKFYEKKVA